MVGGLGCSALGLVVFLGYLLARFGGSGSPPPSPPDRSGTVRIRKAAPVAITPHSHLGIEKSKGGRATSSEKDWPKQSVTLYSELNCKGSKLVVQNTHTERKCTRCMDLCGKKFDSGIELQGKIASLQVSGERAIVSMWSNCMGTWKYPEGSGYLSSSKSGDGCLNLNRDWPPVHVQFHFQDRLDYLNLAKNRAQGGQVQGERDPAKVLERISYWKTTEDMPKKASNGKYVTFLKDCGGFNNIRMGFEHAVLMAWVTGRTLVLPPPEGWYLIDFGPIKRGGSYSKGVTDYKEFFDMDHLMKGMPVVTAQEFFDLERHRLGLPDKFAGALGRENREWKVFLFQKFGGQPWSPLRTVIMDPSINAYKNSNNYNDLLLRGKTPREFGPDMQAKDVIHFPSCHGPNGDQGIYRFLGQIANAVLFADKEREREFKRFWRDHIHYPKSVFQAASRMIAKMGLFGYSALHIRRNDLQYKEVFQKAEQTIRNIEPLLHSGEALYIATDETNDGFFDAIRKKFKVFQWKDVVAEGNVVPYSQKVINILEQTICAGGRTFFGTQKSTFSSYIFRMRGYIGAPDTKEYWHNIRYTGIEGIDKNAQPEVTGSNYMMEDPGMWEDL